jgi:hypothetical protein
MLQVFDVYNLYLRELYALVSRGEGDVSELLGLCIILALEGGRRRSEKCLGTVHLG